MGRTGRSRLRVALGLLVGLPALFVLLAPLLALVGYATGWFAPRRIGDLAGLILLAGAVVAALASAAVAVTAAALAGIGAVATAAVRVVAHVVSRLGR